MRVRRRPIDDELMVDGELVLLHGDEVIVLSEIASTAWQQMSSEVWTSLGTLTSDLEARFGLPEDGDDAVRTLVNDLSSAGLVEIATE